MDIGLMPHIKENSVLLRIIDLMQGNGQLHHAQIGGQVAAGSGNVPHQKFANLCAELLIFLGRQAK